MNIIKYYKILEVREKPFTGHQSIFSDVSSINKYIYIEPDKYCLNERFTSYEGAFDVLKAALTDKDYNEVYTIQEFIELSMWD